MGFLFSLSLSSRRLPGFVLFFSFSFFPFILSIFSVILSLNQGVRVFFVFRWGYFLVGWFIDSFLLSLQLVLISPSVSCC